MPVAPWPALYKVPCLIESGDPALPRAGGMRSERHARLSALPKRAMHRVVFIPPTGTLVAYHERRPRPMTCFRKAANVQSQRVAVLQPHLFGGEIVVGIG